MELLRTVIDYVNAHPFGSLAAAAALAVLFRLLNRKSKLSREADEHMEKLRKERPDYYTKFRPPR